MRYRITDFYFFRAALAPLDRTGIRRSALLPPPDGAALTLLRLGFFASRGSARRRGFPPLRGAAARDGFSAASAPLRRLPPWSPDASCPCGRSSRAPGLLLRRSMARRALTAAAPPPRHSARHPCGQLFGDGLGKADVHDRQHGAAASGPARGQARPYPPGCGSHRHCPASAKCTHAAHGCCPRRPAPTRMSRASLRPGRRAGRLLAHGHAGPPFGQGR